MRVRADEREVLRRHPGVGESHGAPARRQRPAAAEQASLAVDGADGARVHGLHAAEPVAAQQDAGLRAPARVPHLHRVLGLPFHHAPRRALTHHQVPAPAPRRPCRRRRSTRWCRRLYLCCRRGDDGGGEEEEERCCSWLRHGRHLSSLQLEGAVCGLAIYPCVAYMHWVSTAVKCTE